MLKYHMARQNASTRYTLIDEIFHSIIVGVVWPSLDMCFQTESDLDDSLW